MAGMHAEAKEGRVRRRCGDAVAERPGGSGELGRRLLVKRLIVGKVICLGENGAAREIECLCKRNN